MIEQLGESLKMAVNASFALDEAIAESIRTQTANMSKLDLEAGIVIGKEKFDPQLKRDLSQAYCSADVIEICFAQTRAQEAAKRHTFIKAARLLLQ